MSRRRSSFSIHNLSYKSLFITIVFLLIGIVLLSRFVFPKQKISAAWFNDGWRYRQYFPVSNTSGSDQSNFVVSINIGTSALAAAGKIQANCNDIRAISANGNLLKHFVTQCNTANTNVYVQIPVTPSGGSGVYIYYGNPNAPNIETTSIFTYFEGFESGTTQDTWTTGQVSVGVTGGFVNKGNYNLKFMAQGGSWKSVYQTFAVSNNWTNQYLEYEFYSDVAGSSPVWYTDPRDSSTNRMNPWKTTAVTAGSWTTLSQDLNTETYKADIKSIQYFTGNDNDSRNIFIDNFRIRKCLSTVTIGTPLAEEISPAPIFYWKFDEGAGTTLNNSINNGLNGSLGTGTWVSDDQCVSGKCLQFSSGTSASVASDNKLNITSNVSYNIWVKVTGTNANWPLVMGRDPHRAYGFRRDTNSKSLFFEYAYGACDGTVFSQIAIANPTDNKWHMLSMTQDGTNIKVYFDAKQVGSAALSSFCSTALPFSFGNDLTGFIDEAKIYPYARTTAQIKSDYSAGQNHTSSSKGTSANLGSNNKNGEFLSSGLVDYWKLDEASGTALDSSGSGNTVPVTGLNNYGSGKFGNGLRSGVGSTNMFPNPSAEIDLSSWGSWQGTNTRIGTTALFGAFSVMSVQTTAAGYTMFDFDNVVPGYTPGIGQTLTCSVFVKTNSAWNGKAGSLVLRENGGAQANDSASTAFTYTTNWQRVSVTKTIVQPDRTSVDCYSVMSGLGGNDGAFFFSDGLQVEQKSYATPYLDGSFGTGYAWTGTAHASTSTRTSSSATTGLVNDTSGTLSFWFNSPSLDSNSQCPLGSSSGDATGGLFFKLQSSGITATHVFGAGVSAVSQVNTTIPNNTWTHLTYTWDNTSRSGALYLNGQKQQSISYSQAITIGEYLQNLGTCTKTGFVPFNGTLDEVRVYNRSLSPSEVSMLYNWAPGPIGYWDFNDGSGTLVQDKSGLGNTGVWSGTGSHWAQGKYGSAGSFNGSNDYVKINDNSNLDFGSNDFTVSYWVNKRQSSVAWSNTFGVNKWNTGGSPGTNEWSLSLTQGGSDDKPSFAIENGNTSYATASPNNISLNQWHYLTGVKNGPTLLIYVDGLQVGSTNIGNVSVNNVGRDLQIALASTVYTNALFDDFKIYNYARTSKQITEDMNGNHPLGGSPVGSQAGYWKFDEGFGTSTSNWGNSGLGTSAVFAAGNSAPTWTNDGKYNKALTFSANQYVYFNPFSLENAREITISAWVKPASDTYIFQYGCSSSWNGYINQFTVNSNGSLYLDIEDAVLSAHFSDTTSAGLVPMNQWSYVAVTVTSTNIKFYVNGKLVRTSANFNGMYPLHNASANYNNIGRYNYNNTTFTYSSAIIDELKVYTAALSDDEIKVDYNRGSTMQFGSLSSGTGNTAPSTAASQAYCIPGDTVKCSSPVLEWNFDEKIGTVVNDTSGNNNSLALGVSTSTPAWTQGKMGSALNFDGIDDTVYIGNPSALDFGVGSFSYTLWANFNASTGSYDMPWSKGGSSVGSTGFDLELGTGAWGAGLSDGVNNIYGPLGNETLNQWVFISVVVDRTNNKLYTYRNGILIGATSITGLGSLTTTIPAVISPSSYKIKGKIDQIRFYNYARSPAQIAWDYNRGGPIGWWKLDECQGNIAYDWSGIGNTGTINIGASGSQNTVGTCTDGLSTSAWNNGKTGKYNSSLNFDGTDDYVSAPFTALGAAAPFTLSAWIKTSTSFGYEPGIISMGYSPVIVMQTDGKIKAWWYNGTVWPSISSSKICNNGQFHHLVLSYDGTTASLYVDGVFQSNSVSNIQSIYAGFYIGLEQNSGNKIFNGQIDDARVYNYGLNATQIKTLYNNGAVSFSN